MRIEEAGRQVLLTGGQIRKAAAEAVGTFLLVFAGCGALMVAARFPGAVAPGAVPVVFGATVAGLVYALGHISGAHLNPAVTLGFAVARRFPVREVMAYWTAQFLGGILAVLALHFLLPEGAGYGASLPVVSPLQAFCWEMALTFFLMFVVMSVATDTRAVGTMAGAAIGVTVMVDAFLGGPVTGASMNPARSLAPALAEGRLDTLWIYFAGPAAGAVLAALVYQGIRCEEPNRPPPGKDAKGCC